MPDQRVRALVTGAGGFIGSRLVRYLAGRSVRVRALTRRGTVPDLGLQHLCEEAHGDVTDLESVQSASAGCDIIFHCAWGGSSLERARLINVQGTRNVVAAASVAGVRRVVHISSVAVHGTKLPDILTEAEPLRFDGDPYAISKAEGELAALELGSAKGVQVVVLRPTLVYGPRSPIWLLSYFERVKREHLALIAGGTGLANLVYVDDLISVMWSAAHATGVGGEAFLISGEEPVTWREYIGHLARMCGKPVPSSVPLWKARLYVPWLKVYSALTNRGRKTQAMDLTLMTQCTVVSIAKAKRMLRYQPSVSLEEGMWRCAAWLGEKGYLPRADRRIEAG